MGANSSTEAPEKYEDIPARNRIPRVHKISPQQFLSEYYEPKKPVILTGMMDDWPAIQKWTKDYLREQIGQRNHTFKYGKEKITMKVADYLDAADQYRDIMKNNNLDTETKNKQVAGLFPPIPSEEKIPYMRHFGPLRSTVPQLHKDIKPGCLFPDPTKIVFREFLFYGAIGTKTNIHYDDSDNFMAIVYGQKMITLLPPGGETEMNLAEDDKQRLRDFEALPFADPDELRLDLNDSSKSMMMHEHPVFSSAEHLYYSPINPGEIVFFPAKWYHYIHNIDTSVSLTIQTSTMV